MSIDHGDFCLTRKIKWQTFWFFVIRRCWEKQVTPSPFLECSFILWYISVIRKPSNAQVLVLPR